MIAPLLVSSCYSFHYGTAQIDALVARAATLGYKALALTDRNSVYGIPAFIGACSQVGIRPILGTELIYGEGRAVLLAKDKCGFSRISHLLSLRAEGALNARAAISEDHAGLVVLTDDEALLASMAGKEDIYGLLIPGNRRLWRRLTDGFIPCVAAGEARFLEVSDRKIQRVLVAIGNRTTVEQVRDGEIGPPDAAMLSPEEFEAFYRDVPDALRCNENVTDEASLSSLFEHFIFPRYATDEQGGAAALLRGLVLEGAARRYPVVGKVVLERINHELGLIEQKGFCDYFLTVRDIARRASRTCGRGSAAASVVAYCLGITDVDPIRHHLYFERFLNPGRKDPPDIDVDFAWDERDDLLAAVIEYYGEDRTARVSNHVCFQAQSALRETARAYGIPDGEITTYERSRATRPEDSSEKQDDLWVEITSIAKRLVGLPRNLGVHSGGLIIVPGRLMDYVPIERSGGGIRVTAWDKDGVEAAGLVKIDLLGNRSLAVVRDALANLRENGTSIDEDQWRPIDDPETIHLLARGDTMGVFYVESPAMRILQQKTQRGDFEHLVIHSSIIRPAANKYINEYVDRLGGKPWKPLHKLLEGLFDETFGIMCYQEDVSKAAMALAGFSAAEADGIRKILAKKDAVAKLQRYWPAFLAGARARGVDDTTIQTVWDMMRSFSGYSFVKAHSASYAMLSFKSAYLRVHHPAEFMAAVISNKGGFYSTLAYVSEARRMGLALSPPNINTSELRCRGSGMTILWGLELIRSLGAETVNKIIEERKRRGPFLSIGDFGRRIVPGREDAEALVGSGAFDALAQTSTRAQMLMCLLSLQATRERKAFERDLFPLEQPSPKRGNETPPATSDRKRLEHQMTYLGTTLSCHPLALWPRILAYPHVRARDITDMVGRQVRLVGWPITAKQVLTSADEVMEFVSFEDETALFETVIFPREYKKYHRFLYDEVPLCITGMVTKDHGACVVEITHLERYSNTLSHHPDGAVK